MNSPEVQIELGPFDRIGGSWCAVALALKNQADEAQHGSVCLAVEGMAIDYAPSLSLAAGEEKVVSFIVRGEHIERRGRLEMKVEAAFNGAAVERTFKTTWTPLAKVAGDPIAIDGDLSEWRAAPIYLGKPGAHDVAPLVASPANERDKINGTMRDKDVAGWSWRGPSDLSATLYLTWDDNFLYIAADVDDDVHFQPYAEAYLYMADSLQLGVDPDNDNSLRVELQCAKTPTGDLVYARGPVDVDFVAREKEGGMVYELALPAETLGLHLEPGRLFGVNVVLNDNDGDGRKGWLDLTEGMARGKNPAKFVDFLLVGEEPLPLPLPTGYDQLYHTQVTTTPAAVAGDGHSEVAITATVTGANGAAAPDGMVVVFKLGEGSHGIIEQREARLADGQASVLMTVPTLVGEATVIAYPRDANAVSGSATITYEEDTDDAGFFAALDLSAPGLEAVKGAVESSDYAEAKERFLAYMRQRRGDRYPFDVHAKAELLDQKQRLDPDFAETVVVRTDDFWRGVERKLAARPDYNIFGDPENLNFERFPFCEDLGWSYWITGDEKYAELFTLSIRHILERTPQYFCGVDPVIAGESGRVGWITLLIGIRLEALVKSYKYFVHSPSLTPQLHVDLLQFMRMMATMLRYHHGPANWMLIELGGLAAMCHMFPEFKDSSAWLERANYLCEGEILAQVHDDGMHYEQTPGYHICCLRSFLAMLAYAKRTGQTLSQRFQERVERMCEYLLYVATPDHHTPDICDAGRADVHEDLSRAALIFARGDFKYCGLQPYAGESVADEEAYNRIEAHPPAAASRAFADGGYYLMRTDWSDKALYLLADYGKWGYANGHSHNDALGITVAGYGRTLIAEAGTYSYARDKWRAPFAGTAGHSTCVIDGKDQLPVNAKAADWISTDEFDFIDGSHAGYEPLVHRRKILFIKNEYWLVIDIIHGDDEVHQIDQLYWFLPSESVAGARLDPTTKIACSGYDDANIMLLPVIPEVTAEKLDGWLALGSGAKTVAPKIRYRQKARAPIVLATVLYPFEGTERPSVAVERRDVLDETGNPMSPEDAIGVEVRAAKTTDTIIVANHPAAMKCGETETTGKLAYARTDGQGKLIAQFHAASGDGTTNRSGK